MYKIYTRNSCIYCDMAKALMKENDIDFMEINIDFDNEEKLLLKEQGHKTVPQIYNEVNSHIGGYTELLDIFKKEI
jgi:glutaredoxin